MTGTQDFAAIEQRAADGDESCRLAITLYAHRIRKYIGAYAAVMGGVDAIVYPLQLSTSSSALVINCRRNPISRSTDNSQRKKQLRLSDREAASIKCE
jgi:acetate kinase